MSRTVLQHGPCPRGNGNPNLGGASHHGAFPRQAVPANAIDFISAKVKSRSWRGALVMASFFVARDSNTYSDCVNQIVADQAGCDCDRKLGSGSRPKPMLFIGRAAVHGVPPAVEKTCCDCQHDEKGEPPARSVEESFRMAFPTGHHQTEQAKNASNGHTSQGKSQSRAKPEGDQEGKAKKESGGETGRPHIHGSDPTPALPACRASAVAQSKGKQNHSGKGEENK